MRAWSSMLGAVPRTIVLGLLAGCGSHDAGVQPPRVHDTAPDERPRSDEALSLLSPLDRLARISFALRGLPPGPDDVHAVEDDPDALESIALAYVLDPAFGDTIEDMHAEQLHLRVDVMGQGRLPQVGLLEGVPVAVSDHYVTEAPLRLVRHVVETGQPYTDIATTDVTLSNEIMHLAFGVPFDPDGSEWQVQTHDDGRPAAGLLAETHVYRRWTSNGNNLHRGRANLLSSFFLCEDISAQNIAIDGDLLGSDPEVVARAVQSDPTCSSCHATLDPLASFLWGFKPTSGRFVINQAHRLGCVDGPSEEFRYDDDVIDYCYPMRLYAPETEGDWAAYGLPAPAYDGAPAEGLDTLGARIAADPRFATCAARRFYSYLTQTPLGAVPDDVVTELTDGFVASGHDARQLAVAVVLHPSFQAAPFDPDGAPQASSVGMQALRPEQLTRTVEALTGFVWTAVPDEGDCGTDCTGAVDLMRSDLYGYRSMAGGIDGFYVDAPTHTTTPVKLLVAQAYAAEAAAHVVAHDAAAAPDARRLFQIDPRVADPDAVRAQLAALHQRVLGASVAPDDEGVDLSFVLYDTVLQATADPLEAWRVVLVGLFLDPNLMVY